MTVSHSTGSHAHSTGSHAHSADYRRIARAIEFLTHNFRRQPTLEEVAGHVHLSPFHFQRLFRSWAGVTPKQFVQYLTAEYARQMLRDTGATLFDTALESGLSGTGRLHDLFIRVEGMTPGEYKYGGAGLAINYSMADSPFGPLMVASTDRGICSMAFAEHGEEAALLDLQQRFPRARYTRTADALQHRALAIFTRDWTNLEEIRLHLKGTEFQLRVWSTLLRIPAGGLATYASVAGAMGRAGAARAVGSAVGSNPVAVLIPCHRVIPAGGGTTGQYRWGGTRKQALIAWEAAGLHHGRE